MQGRSRKVKSAGLFEVFLGIKNIEIFPLTFQLL